MNERFSLYRLNLLVRGDLIHDYRAVLIASTTIAIIMLVQAIPAAYVGEIEHRLYTGWFSGILFIWGAIAASLCFDELHDKTQNERYLLLPASALEKTTARVLYITVLFITYQLLFVTLVSLVAEGLNMLLFGRHNPLFNPLDGANWRVIALYFGGHGVFFLGAAWFRSKHWLKTCFTLALLGIGVGVFSTIVIRLVFADYFNGWQMVEIAEADLYWSIKDLLDGTAALVNYVFYVLLAPFCWYVAWLRVKETQVSHGV